MRWRTWIGSAALFAVLIAGLAIGPSLWGEIAGDDPGSKSSGGGPEAVGRSDTTSSSESVAVARQVDSKGSAGGSRAGAPSGAVSKIRAPSGRGGAAWHGNEDRIRRMVDEVRRRGRSTGRGYRPRDPGALPRLAGLEMAGVLQRAGTPLRIGDVRHSQYRVWKAGLPIFNRGGRLHEKGGRLVGRTGRLGFPPPSKAQWDVSREEVLQLTLRELGIASLRGSPRVERGWQARPGATVPAWRVTLAAARPFGSWRVVLHAGTGEILAVENRLRYAAGIGRVYRENPVSTPIPEDLPLAELDETGFLAGRITEVFDVRAVEAFRPDRVFSYPEDDPRFTQTSIYRSLTDTGVFGEAHGFPLFTTPVIALSNLPDPSSGGEFNNAFYDPFLPMLGFGNGDGSLTQNIGLDRDVAAHEMGHHLFQMLVDPLAMGSFSALTAIDEGVADTFAALLSGDPEIGESTLPAQEYLRTLDNDRAFPWDYDLDPHVEGLVYGGFNWDLIRDLGAGTFADILVAGLPYLPLELEFPHEYRDALLWGDLDVTKGDHAEVIQQRARERGLDWLEQEGVTGFLEERVPEVGVLADESIDFYLFSEFPGSEGLRFYLDDNGSGRGDADLLVAPISIFDPNNEWTYFWSERPGSFEYISISGSTMPSVDADDSWFVFVYDYPDGAQSPYRLRVETTFPSPGIAVGQSRTGSLDEAGEMDFVTFLGSAGQVVRVEVTAFEDALDLAVVVFDPIDIEIFGADDDSGPGFDPLIQGARLPTAGTYALAVFSPLADVDPTVGIGSYRIDLSLCANTGSDLDGDGLSDECDDDEDDDGFIDSIDFAPRAAGRCYDIEADGCDDCSSGDFDPFDDGPDFDGDTLCDAGDPDDDNDGCEDEIDPSPLSASIDEDLDFVGAHCDNCPQDHNPDQLDRDKDGLGDVCDPTPTPEPAPAIQGALALLALAWLRRRAHRKAIGKGIRC